MTLDVSKYYVLLVEAKNIDASTVTAYIDYGTGSLYGDDLTSYTTSFGTSYKKFKPTSVTVQVGCRVYDGGSTIGSAYFDGIRLYEIDQATYDKIDVDPEYTSDKLAEKFPYVDSVQHLQNPTVTVQGKNLLPPLSDWSISSLTTANSPYSFTKRPTSTWSENVKVVIPCLPSQQYTIAVTAPSTSGVSVTIKGIDAGGSVIGSYIISTGITNTASYTFTTPSNAVTMSVEIKNSVVATLTASDFILSLGSTALPFEPANPSYLYALTTLAEGETMQEIDGQQVKTKKWQTGLRLDGSLAWDLSTDFTGFKRGRTVLTTADFINDTGVVTNYKGDVLTRILFEDIGIKSGIGSQALGHGTGHIYIDVADTETGFGETYTPLAAEVKAYFYGWRMNNGVFGTPYNGTGTKTWAKMSATDNAGAVTTCPTTQAAGEGNYTLHYQLATPVTEAVQVEGAVSFVAGLNQYELGEGVIVREVASPYYYSSFYYFNDLAFSACYAKYRVDKILQVYRNGLPDDQWTIHTDSAYGKNRAKITSANYDPTAVYSVTYIALDKYLLTNNAVTATGEYQTNLRTVVTEVVADLANVQTDVTILKNTTAKKLQGQWIAPTLVNSWVTHVTPGYLKDDMGFVHLKGAVKTGTVPSVAFTLPAGYRPSVAIVMPITSNNAYGQLTIGTDGTVTVNIGNTASVYLDGVTFRAE
jgi:hypothetical protein